MSNESTIWNFLTSRGFSQNATAGIMGNLQEESGFNPNALNSIGAYGIAQWLGGRKTALQHYAYAHGSPPSSLNTQLNYLVGELSSGRYGSIATLNGLAPAQAASYFERNFEKAGAGAHMATRQADAVSIFHHFHGHASTGSGLLNVSASVGSSQTNGPSAYSKSGNIISEINRSLQITNFDVFHPVNSITQDAGAILLRTVLVVVGLIFLIFALVAAV